MIQKVNKKAIKFAVLCTAMIFMGPVAISPILASLMHTFPGSSVTTIQSLETYPSIVVIIAAMAMGKLSALVPKKVLACIGTFLIALMGVGAYFFHGSVAMLYVWATLLGIGIGMAQPSVIAITTDYFEGSERGAIMGLQSSATNLGSMLMSFVGGILAATAWQANYLVYLLALLGLFTCLLWVPNKPGISTAPQTAHREKEKLNPLIYYYVAIAFVFVSLFNVSPVNFAMIISERGLGGASFAGTVTSIFLLGGIISGIFYGPISRQLKSLTVSCGCTVLFAGYLLISLFSGLPTLLIGAFIAGTSICLVIPKVTFDVTRLSTPATVGMAAALITAASNAGAFLAPVYTFGAQALFGSGSEYRFLLAGITAAFFAVVFGIVGKKVEA